jgi:hypothetical protein
MLPPRMSDGIFIFRMMLYTVVSGLQTVLLGTLTWRKQYREFRAFYVYTGFQVAQAVAFYWILYLYSVHRVSYMAYFYPYWSGAVVDALLCFWIVYSIFRDAFSGHPNLRRLGQLIFSVTLVVVLAATVIAAAVSPGNERVRMMAAILLLARSVAIVRCGLLLLLFVTSSYLGLSWRSPVLGIALGLGIWSASDLMTQAVRLYVGVAAEPVILWSVALGYSAAVVMWAVYFLPPQPVHDTAIDVCPRGIQTWNMALSDLLRGESPAKLSGQDNL